MVSGGFRRFLKESSVGAMAVLKQTAIVLKSHPEITLYPYAAAILVSLTYPIASATILAHWYQRVFTDTNVIVPGRARAILGLVGFLAFYSAFIAAYFTTAVTANVISKLEGHPTPPFYGISLVIKHFFRVTKFAVISIFFFPLGIIAQRRKLPGGWAGALGASLTLHMAQAAPAILTTPYKVLGTLRHSIDMLGKAWRVSLMIKVWMYCLVFLLVVLPKLIQHGLFKSHAASDMGWIIGIELGASGLVAFKVLNSIFTAVLYHQAMDNKDI